MTTLLIPVDGSDYSLKAVDYAAYRARESKAPLHGACIDALWSGDEIGYQRFSTSQPLR